MAGWALLLALGWCSVSLAARIDAPCSACRAIAEVLQTRIDQEPTRNHLDMRHRLDSQGQRYGRLIEYKVSELRVIELLENLCSEMNQFTLVTVSTPSPAQESPPSSPPSSTSSTWHWDRVSKASSGTRPPQQEEEVRQKQLTTYCGRVLEDYDEEITLAIQKGELENGGASSWLCGTSSSKGLMGVCPPKTSSHTHHKASHTQHMETDPATQVATDATESNSNSNSNSNTADSSDTATDAAATSNKAEL